MELKDLTALGVPEEQAKNVLSLHEKELGKVTAARDSFKAENDALKGQLAERGRDIEALKASAGDADAVKKKLSELEDKYEADTKRYQEQIAARDYSDAIRGAIEAKQVKFSSKAAERAFIADLREKKLQLDGGNLLGFDDFLASQKTDDPYAFADEAKPLRFSQGASQPGTPPVTRDSFLSMSYEQQYKFKAENPDLYNTMMKG